MSSTRLHSSRMRTARALTVSPSMLCGGGGVSAPGGRCLLPGGCLLRGSAPGGGGIPACTVADHTHPPCEQNHTRL